MITLTVKVKNQKYNSDFNLNFTGERVIKG